MPDESPQALGQFQITTEHDHALVKILQTPNLKPTPKTVRSLCQIHGDIALHLLTSARLQAKARQKFGDGVWWCTERSLQQSTPWQVAKLKASWFADTHVYDLCCGLGGDLLAFADRGPVTAIDLDPVVSEMAAANLRGTDRHANFKVADVAEISVPPAATIHLDPDRRVDNGLGSDQRTLSPEHYSPDWSTTRRLAESCSGALIKLAPAATIDADPEWHRVWISLQGSVREQSVLIGSVRHAAGLRAGGISAIAVKSDGSFDQLAGSADDDIHVASATEIQGIMVDPDAAIRAAGLTETFAARHDLQTLGGPQGFLSGPESDQPVPMAVQGKILWSGSPDDRAIRRNLRTLDAFPQRVKTRGVDHDPAKLMRRYKSTGTQPVTLWIGRRGAESTRKKSSLFAAITT